LPLDLKFGGLKFDVDSSKFEIRSSRRLGIGSLLDSKPGAALRGVDAKFLVDLKFGIASEVGGSKFGEVCRSVRSPLYSKPGSS
jgi:hypothetical protein